MLYPHLRRLSLHSWSSLSLSLPLSLYPNVFSPTPPTSLACSSQGTAVFINFSMRLSWQQRACSSHSETRQRNWYALKWISRCESCFGARDPQGRDRSGCWVCFWTKQTGKIHQAQRHQRVAAIERMQGPPGSIWVCLQPWLVQPFHLPPSASSKKSGVPRPDFTEMTLPAGLGSGWLREPRVPPRIGCWVISGWSEHIRTYRGLMENPIKMDDLGVPLFQETPILEHWNGNSSTVTFF